MELDIVVFDLCMRDGGVESVRAILAARAGVRVVILTASDHEQHLCGAIGAGAAGYLLKGVSGIELLRTIEMVHNGEPYVTPSLAWQVLKQSKVEPLFARSADTAQNKRIDLSRREHQVLDHITEGLSNMEIAAKLGLSVTNVKRHISALFRKIGVRNRMEAANVAQMLKLA